MIKRVNLIEKPPFALTLQRLAQGVLVVVLLNAALAAWQYYKVATLKPQLTVLQTRIDELKEEKKSLEKKPVIKRQEKVQVGEYQNLFEVLNAYPKWAGVMSEITGQLPNAVWLTGLNSEIMGEKSAPSSVTSSQAGGAVDAQNADAALRLSSPSGIKITLTGLASDVDGLSMFIKNLQTSHVFSKTVIQGSQRQSFGFEFTITSELNMGEDENSI